MTGGEGQLGRAIAAYDWPEGWQVVAMGRGQLDLSDPVMISTIIASQNWAAVISAGAYTAVDRAEQEPVAAWTINALAPAALAAACHAGNIPLIHVSTDYVFDGEGKGPHLPDDATRPINVYGASKLGGELAVRASCPRHVIVRTSWVVSPRAGNFVTTMISLAADRDKLRVVNDQTGNPTVAADLAAALATIAIRLADDRDSPLGTFHFTSKGETNWADFARAIFAGSKARGGASAVVVDIPSTDYPTPARRPRNSRLDCSSAHSAFGLVGRPWQDALEDLLDQQIGRAQ